MAHKRREEDPCYGCERRYSESKYNCHSECPDYLAIKEKKRARAEIDALTVYADMVRREMIRKVFDDVEELLQMRYRFENKRGGICEDEYDRCRHFYGRNVCESLLIDLLQIKKRYADETD